MELPPVKKETTKETMQRVTGIDITRCPQCGTGRIVVITRIPAAFYRDTS